MASDNAEYREQVINEQFAETVKKFTDKRTRLALAHCEPAIKGLMHQAWFEASLLHEIKGNATVERDERAEFEGHPRFKGMDFTRAPQHPDYYESAYADGCWHGWQARAALDKSTEGSIHE